MNYYTKEEKIQIVKWFYGGNSAKIVRDLFSVHFPESQIPSVEGIRKMIKQFEQTGSVLSSKNKMQVLEPDATEMEVLICAAIEEDSTLSCYKLADMFQTNKTNVFRILRKHGYSSFKVSKHQQICDADLERRMVFCEQAMEMANGDDQFIKNILFSDESSFPLLGRHNPSVVRYWSRTNQHRFNEFGTQYPQKLNIWSGILGDNIIGPFVINGNLNGVRYLELLQNQIIPAVQQLDGVELRDIWFQQDGCPAHNTLIVREYLANIFPDKWIGTHGPIRWPARSPDLSPNDFFYWGYLKTSIYGHNNTRPQNLEELREKIFEVSNNITPLMLSNVRNSFYNRLGYCLAKGGGLFEHELH